MLLGPHLNLHFFVYCLAAAAAAESVASLQFPSLSLSDFQSPLGNCRIAGRKIDKNRQERNERNERRREKTD